MQCYELSFYHQKPVNNNNHCNMSIANSNCLSLPFARSSFVCSTKISGSTPIHSQGSPSKRRRSDVPTRIFFPLGSSYSAGASAEELADAPAVVSPTIVTVDICFIISGKSRNILGPKPVPEEFFSPGRRTLSVQDYMLDNKADTALKLLEDGMDRLVVSDYILQALTWIRE